MMMSTNIKTTAEELLQPIIDKEQLELVDIEYVKEGRDWFLRVYIDKVDGVTIDECEYVSKLLSDKLDEVDLIPGHYYLEVSSPGVERPLKTKEDFIKNINRNVYVNLYVHINGIQEYEGILIDFSDDINYIQ